MNFFILLSVCVSLALSGKLIFHNHNGQLYRQTATTPPKGKCPNTSEPSKPIGQITYKEIYDASGLVESQLNKDIFWTLNDGGMACVFAVYKDGSKKYKCCLVGARNRDWEAISTGPCTKG